MQAEDSRPMSISDRPEMKVIISDAASFHEIVLGISGVTINPMRFA